MQAIVRGCGDALRGEFRLVGVRLGENGNPGRGSVVSGEGGFRRILDGRREQGDQRVHKMTAGLRREVHGSGPGFHSVVVGEYRKNVKACRGRFSRFAE